MTGKNSAEMKEYYGAKTGKRCAMCRKELRPDYFYKRKPLCYRCWKHELHGRNAVRDIEARLKSKGVL